MAALAPVHWQTVTAQMREALIRIGQCPFAERFYLAGGTALALRLGHRRSVDLDFFSATDEVTRSTRREIVQALLPLGVQVLEDVDGNLLVQVLDMHVGFFSYGYPLLTPTETVERVRLAGLMDIGLMKLDALIDRGSRKDFYDLFMIAQHVPLLDLLAQGEAKYPHVRDFMLMAVESMVLFDNADRDVPPPMLIPLAWQDVKAFFIAQAQSLGQRWFKIEQE